MLAEAKTTLNALYGQAGTFRFFSLSCGRGQVRCAAGRASGRRLRSLPEIARSRQILLRSPLLYGRLSLLSKGGAVSEHGHKMDFVHAAL